MKPDKCQVAKRLQLVREEMDISISEFGVILGNYSKSTVNSWLRGLALAPDRVIRRSSKLSSIYSEEWIRWGSIRDIVDTYIIQSRYQEFAKNYSEKINEIIKKIEMLIKNISTFEEKIQIVEMVIESIYQPLFNEFINIGIQKYSDQIPNYVLNHKESDYFYKNEYKNHVWNKINCEPKSRKICYGDVSNLDKIAYCEFIKWIDKYIQENKQYYNDNNLLKYLVENTQDVDGVKRLLSNINFQNRFSINYKTELSKEIVDFFLNMHLDLKNLELNSTFDEKKDTFNK